MMHLEVCDESKINFVLLVDWHFSMHYITTTIYTVYTTVPHKHLRSPSLINGHQLQASSSCHIELQAADAHHPQAHTHTSSCTHQHLAICIYPGARGREEGGRGEGALQHCVRASIQVGTSKLFSLIAKFKAMKV